MKLLHIYKNTLRLPKKEARIYLSKTDLKGTMLYLLSLVLLTTVPELSQVLRQNELESGGVFYVQVILIGLFFSIFTILAGISVVTFVLMLFSRLVQRKLQYQYLWKMAAFSLPMPMLVSFLLGIMLQVNWITLGGFILVFSFIHYKLITAFPRRKLKLQK